MRVICLGTAKPIAYRTNPRPPPNLELKKIEYFATDICGLDISDIPAVDTDIMTGPEDARVVAYTMTDAHRASMIRELIETPVQIPWVGGKARTKIKFPDNYSAKNILNDVAEIWKRQGNSDGSAPGWIAGNEEAESLVALLAGEMQITEVRPYDEDDT